MIEKKYMTASEDTRQLALKIKDLWEQKSKENRELQKLYYKIVRVVMSKIYHKNHRFIIEECKRKLELDTHFINKEELKDKIKLILDKHRDRFPTSIENGAIIYREEIEKEILEMLK